MSDDNKVPDEAPDGEAGCECAWCQGLQPSGEIPDEMDYGFLSYVGKPDPADFDAHMHLMDSEPYGEIPRKGERIVVDSGVVVDSGALSPERVRERERQHFAAYGETPAQYRAKQRRGQSKPVGIQPVAQPSPLDAGVHAALEAADILEANPAIAEVVDLVLNPPQVPTRDAALDEARENLWNYEFGPIGKKEEHWPESGDLTHFGPEYFHEKPEPKDVVQSATSNVISFPTSHDQPPPIPNDSDAVWPQVIEDLDELEMQGPAMVLDAVAVDMDERSQVGIKRYGVALQPFNGRDALRDAYAESLDQVVYLKQAYIESDSEAEMQEIDALYVNTLENTIQLRHLIALRDGLE